jgi:hypothetical protein
MSNPRSRLRSPAVQFVVLALLLAAPAATAQSQADADLKAISAYVLTLPKYQQYLDATVNLANEAAKNPQLAGRLEGYGDQPVAAQVKLLDGVPQIRGAITAAGLTSRDFVLLQGALLQAGMAHAFTKDGTMPTDDVIKKSGVSRVNLEFYQKNEAEIGRRAKEAEARASKPPDDEEDPDDDGEE